MGADSEHEVLTVDKLASGDRPSIYTAGILISNLLKSNGYASLGVDVLGRVHIVPLPADVVRATRPRVCDDDLHHFSEEEALQVLVNQGDDEDKLLAYLRRRAENGVPSEGSRDGVQGV